MNKKDLKFYEAPACEVMELEAKTVLLAGSGETNDPNTTVTPPQFEGDED